MIATPEIAKETTPESELPTHAPHLAGETPALPLAGAARAPDLAAAAWWAALLFLGALLLRLVPALVPVYWYDEIYTVAITRFSFAEIARITIGDVHPPLFYWLVKEWSALGEPWVGTVTAMPWLRAVPVAAGMLLCVAMWRGVRERWAPGDALGLLALAAFSPGLAAYSVELRNYSLTHALMVCGSLALIRAIEANPETGAGSRRARAAWLTWILSWSAALYAHNLALLYFCAQVAIFAGEVWRRDFFAAPGTARVPTRSWAENAGADSGGPGWRARARGLALAGLVSAAAVALAYAPWVPALLEQNRLLQGLKLEWLPAPTPGSVASTFLYHFVFGFINDIPLAETRGWIMMGLAGAALAGLVAAGGGFARRRSNPPPAAPATAVPASRGFDRLAIHAALMVLLPLCAAYALSAAGRSKIFLPARYNMLALPFWVIFVAGLARRIPSAGRRGFAFAALSIVSLAAAIPTQIARLSDRDEFARLEANETPAPRPLAGDHYFWLDLNDHTAPWLSRCGSRDIGRLDGLLKREAAPPSGSDWLVSHRLAYDVLGGGETRLRLFVAERLAARGELEAINAGPFWVWFKIWRVPPAGRAALARETQTARAALAAGRAALAPPGGQLILPGDAPLADRTMWSVEEYDADYRVSCWSIGERQSLSWRGPERSGIYLFRATFWRPQPFPTAELVIKAKVPGEEKFTRYEAPVGGVVVEAPAVVNKPGETLRAEFKIPSWRPSEFMGVQDSRELGIQLISIEMIPM